jgi:hypothetical protein
MKTLTPIFLLIALTVSAQAFTRHAPEPAPSPITQASPAPAPSSMPVVGVVFDPVDYYTTVNERLQILAAGAVANAVIYSPCFAVFMSKRALIQTNNQSVAEVVSRLQNLSGIVPVEMYYTRFTSAEAYRQPPSITVHLNRKYFTADTPVEIMAATLGHEAFGHALGGYDHDFKWSPSRSFSVPYSIGGADEAQGGDAFDACWPLKAG